MKLSVVTINRNNASGLRKTIESVVNQTFHDFEYIVIDGASDDGSVDVIKEFADKIIYWVSEPDGGIYSAMNKGVRKAQGEYVLMLNSGDYLCGKSVVENILPELDGVDIVQGNRIEEHDDGLWLNRGYGKSELSFLDVQRGHFLHQATFSKRVLFEKYGYFDESYKYVSDTVFFVKTLGYGDSSFRYVDINVVFFDMNGVSNSGDVAIRKKHAEEVDRMNRELFPGRLYGFCRESERKIELYDEQKSFGLWWKTTMMFKTIYERLNKKPNLVNAEKIDKNIVNNCWWGE